jgi:gamma-glutamyl:cysteine ligase YbdK (ATP-grasp superfamily)
MAHSLFSCYGVELEYMIVQSADLRVAPWADRVLVDAAGKPVSDVDRGPVTWSNELIAHVVEMKTSEPAPTLDGLAAVFASEVRELNRRFRPHGARLLPTAMHPTMTPDEAVLWTHEFSEVYATFDRIFDCRGHGWSNLQSAHLNLPFHGDEEFARLHAAVRLVLPLLPALAASSPFVEGVLTGLADNRLDFYRRNSAKLPALCGEVIPEPVYSESDYERVIYAPIAAQVAPHDPDGTLEPVYTNSRGAIARFDRGSIEIRLLDLQECPAADLAVLRTAIAVLKDLVAESRVPLAAQKLVPVAPLRRLFDATVAEGEAAMVTDTLLLQAADGRGTLTAGEWWRRQIERLNPAGGASPEEQAALETYVRAGMLSRRLTEAHRAGRSVEDLYRRLADLAEENQVFRGVGDV